MRLSNIEHFCLVDCCPRDLFDCVILFVDYVSIYLEREKRHIHDLQETKHRLKQWPRPKIKAGSFWEEQKSAKCLIGRPDMKPTVMESKVSLGTKKSRLGDYIFFYVRVFGVMQTHEPVSATKWKNSRHQKTKEATLERAAFQAGWSELSWSALA